MIRGVPRTVSAIDIIFFCVIQVTGGPPRGKSKGVVGEVIRRMREADIRWDEAAVPMTQVHTADGEVRLARVLRCGWQCDTGARTVVGEMETWHDEEALAQSDWSALSDGATSCALHTTITTAHTDMTSRTQHGATTIINTFAVYHVHHASHPWSSLPC